MLRISRGRRRNLSASGGLGKKGRFAKVSMLTHKYGYHVFSGIGVLDGDLY